MNDMYSLDKETVRDEFRVSNKHVEKLYSVTVRTRHGVPLIVFLATLEKARLRAHIHRLQGLVPSRPAYCPSISKRVADQVNRGQLVSPSLRR